MRYASVNGKRKYALNFLLQQVKGLQIYSYCLLVGGDATVTATAAATVCNNN